MGYPAHLDVGHLQRLLSPYRLTKPIRGEVESGAEPRDRVRDTTCHDLFLTGEDVVGPLGEVRIAEVEGALNEGAPRTAEHNVLHISLAQDGEERGKGFGEGCETVIGDVVNHFHAYPRGTVRDGV